METKTIIFVGIAIAGLLLLSNSASATNTSSPIVDLSNLDEGADNIARLQNLEDTLQQNNLTDLQIKMMLAQALQETGLFTNNANYNATDNLNNYAGISNPDGSLMSFPDLQTFVTKWISVLSYNNDPLGATNIVDFNNRLKANGYYTDSQTTYGNNLQIYFNELSA